MLPRLFTLMLAVGVAIGVTGPKLYKMAQIKGWFPGATAADRTVTQKWRQPPSRRHPREQDTYWIATTREDIQKAGPHRINLTVEKWGSLKTGDKIEIISLPDDPTPYTRDGIFVSSGNFATDLGLFAAELAVAGIMAWQLLRLNKRT